MPSAMPPSNPPSRTPAWKRLGLKLKSTPEIPAGNAHEEIDSSAKKRKAEADITPHTKKSKKSKEPLAAPATPTTPALSKKKSVTFTPETKVEDGDSIRQLFNSWVAEQKAQDPDFASKITSKSLATPEPAKVQEDFDTTLDEKERRVKRVEKPQPAAKDGSKEKSKKKAKASKVVKATPAPTSRPFLAYLKQYHEDRGNWKFNKNHQNHILKNLFDVDAVPSEYAPSIYAYIKGLQGGVRTRLRDTALSIKVKDLEAGADGFAESMSGSTATDREKRQQQYEEFCQEYVATMTKADEPREMGYEEGALLGLSDAAMKARVAKRARAEMVLVEMGAGATPAEAEERATPRDSGLTFREGGSGDGDGQKNDGPAPKVARKRKQRTANVEEDSSSSSDSSNSDDSDSDSDDAEEDERDDRSEETSSSSSSSSSGSESGDSDDDESGSGSGSGSGSSGSGSEEESEDGDSDIQ